MAEILDSTQYWFMDLGQPLNLKSPLRVKYKIKIYHIKQKIQLKIMKFVANFQKSVLGS